MNGSALALRRWSVRLALAFVVGMVLAFGMSEAARAISDVDRKQFTRNLCVEERSETDEASSGVLFGESVTRLYSGLCSSELSKPAGYIAGRVEVWKWDSRDEEWDVCRSTDWKYNTERTDEHVVRTKLGREGDRRCGPGYYGTWAQGSVWHDDAWRTTEWVWSGFERFD